MMHPRVDVAALNAVANDPDILPHIAAGFDAIDLAAFYTRPGNVAFGDGDGFVLFGGWGDGIFEIHYLLTARCRGAAALRRVRAALDFMFTDGGAVAICGGTPRENRAARAMNRALGAKPVGTTSDRVGRPCILYVLERHQWISSAPSSAALAH